MGRNMTFWNFEVFEWNDIESKLYKIPPHLPYSLPAGRQAEPFMSTLPSFENEIRCHPR